jgi:hypothetical protein
MAFAGDNKAPQALRLVHIAGASNMVRVNDALTTREFAPQYVIADWTLTSAARIHGRLDSAQLRAKPRAGNGATIVLRTRNHGSADLFTREALWELLTYYAMVFGRTDKVIVVVHPRFARDGDPRIIQDTPAQWHAITDAQLAPYGVTRSSWSDKSAVLYYPGPAEVRAWWPTRRRDSPAKTPVDGLWFARTGIRDQLQKLEVSLARQRARGVACVVQVSL